MRLCVVFLCGPLDHKVMHEWLHLELFQHHVLHVEELVDVSPAGGTLTADPFAVPSDVDIKAVDGLAIINSETQLVEPRYGFQVPALGITCLKDQNIFCLRGWSDEPETEEYSSDCSILDDPCALYKELRCCYYNLTKKRQKVAVSFRDRNVRFAPSSKEDDARLFRMMMEANADCECKGRSSEWRGGSLGHSCARNSRNRGGCC